MKHILSTTIVITHSNLEYDFNLALTIVHIDGLISCSAMLGVAEHIGKKRSLDCTPPLKEVSIKERNFLLPSQYSFLHEKLNRRLPSTQTERSDTLCLYISIIEYSLVSATMHFHLQTTLPSLLFIASVYAQIPTFTTKPSPIGKRSPESGIPTLKPRAPSATSSMTCPNKAKSIPNGAIEALNTELDQKGANGSQW